PIPGGGRCLPTWGVLYFLARPPTSPSCSPTKPRSGARWSGRPTLSRSEADPVSAWQTLAVLTPKIVSWIDQYLCELVRRGQADFVSGAERRPSCKYGSYEYERNRTAFEHLVGDHFLGVFAKDLLCIYM